MRTNVYLITALLVVGSGEGVVIHHAGASIEAYGSHAEWLHEFVSSVKTAARNGPAWRMDSHRVQRYIEDIEYHAEAMIEAGKTADRARAEEEREQVHVLLSRGLARGYFTNADIESLLRDLGRYLPGSPS